MKTSVKSYGNLPDGITIEDLKIENNSILRNPDVAQMCFYRQYIEMLGSGTQRMIRDCKENKFKIPRWRENDNITTVTFPDVANNRIIEGITVGTTKGKLERINKVLVANVKGITEGITDDVTDKIIRIIILLYKEGGIKTLDIESLTAIPAKSVERYIKQLRDSGIIEFRGANRTGGYIYPKA